MDRLRIAAPCRVSRIWRADPLERQLATSARCPGGGLQELAL